MSSLYFKTFLIYNKILKCQITLFLQFLLVFVGFRQFFLNIKISQAFFKKVLTIINFPPKIIFDGNNQSKPFIRHRVRNIKNKSW